MVEVRSVYSTLILTLVVQHDNFSSNRPRTACGLAELLASDHMYIAWSNGQLKSMKLFYLALVTKMLEYTYDAV
jgi:hypothetical protein